MSMRDRLRTSTIALHAAVDARFAPLVADGVPGYRQFLHASAAAILPLEKALDAGGITSVIADWSQRARSDALRRDLSDLGAMPPDDRREIFVGDAAYQLGILYVLEGSRLGATMLVRRLQDAEPRVREATRYLRHGEGQGLWRSFLDQLESSSAVRAAPERALAGAVAAFGLFGATEAAS